MKRKNFENIGKVAINEIELCDTLIGLYIPIEEMSEKIRSKYEESEKYFTAEVSKKYPELDLTQHTLFRDIALHMNFDDKNKKVCYSVAIILWIEDKQGKEIYAEFFDPFDVEINDKDSRHLKKLVLQKLLDTFF